MCCGLHVVVNSYPCCGEHAHQCCPQHVPHNTSLVLHTMSHTLHCGYVVGACCGQHLPMLWMTCSRMLSTTHALTCSPQHMMCCGAQVPFFKNFQHTPTMYKAVHNIHPQHMFLDMLWVYVVENNQHMLWSTHVVECNDFYRCRKSLIP